ncbi:ComEA family DNA-binding protein [Bordetella genomosp. 13]|uniref:ComEA family DNA-binding protein n=1 Tax=Bordetella genomosp. 13 TaxID=463040 RepID=UPI0011A7333D|nr:helix-hairpin-helix domain-containing protein [Bordetella genomosp. 13]
MNPFTHEPVAQHRPEACRFVARIPSAGRPTRRLLARTVGRLAVAGTLGLAALPACALDVNTANAEQLEAVRGVGPRMAQTIVQERTRGGRFESLEDLSDRVRGIGPKRAQALQAAGLTVGPDGAAVAKPVVTTAPAGGAASAPRRPAAK